MIERAYCFICDYCGQSKHYLSDNIKEAKRIARCENWILSSKHGAYCSSVCYIDHKREMTDSVLSDIGMNLLTTGRKNETNPKI